jgi:predicted small metal-binding protein
MANDRKQNDPMTPSQVGGGINPSAPTQGTEGPSTNLGSTSRGDNASMRQSSGQTPSGVGPTGMNPSTAGNNPTATRPGTEGGGNLSFRCADAGQSSCDWQTSGRNEDEIRDRVGQHAREHHGFKEWTLESWDKVRGAIRRAAA